MMVAQLTCRHRDSLSETGRALTVFAAQHQRDVIVPHCPQCKNPCCNLSKVVLDMTWAQTKARLAEAERLLRSLRGHIPSETGWGQDQLDEGDGLLRYT